MYCLIFLSATPVIFGSTHKHILSSADLPEPSWLWSQLSHASCQSRPLPLPEFQVSTGFWLISHAVNLNFDSGHFLSASCITYTWNLPLNIISGRSLIALALLGCEPHVEGSAGSFTTVPP